MTVAHTFSNYGLWQTSSNFFQLNSVFWPLWCLLWKLSFNTKEDVENTIFLNEATPPVRKNLCHFSCNILTKKKMEQLISVPKVLLNLCRSYKISSIGLKRSLEKTSQKSLSCRWKIFWSFFPQITWDDTHWVTFC